VAAFGLNVLQPVPRRRWGLLFGRKRRATTIDLRGLSAPHVRRHRRSLGR
jgi:hypothetical protein